MRTPGGDVPRAVRSRAGRSLDKLPPMRLIHVDDGSGVEPLPGAFRYEELLAAGSPEPLDLTPSPDDLYVLYTGGTTGMPKGVLWRQNDIYLNAMGGRAFGTGEMMSGLDEIVARALRGEPGSLSCAPLMHGAAQWSVFSALCSGRKFVMSSTTKHFECRTRPGGWPAGNAWLHSDRRRRVRPAAGGALEALDLDECDLSALNAVVSGGALSAPGSRTTARAAPERDRHRRRRIIGVRLTDGPDLQRRRRRYGTVLAQPGCGGGQRGHEPHPDAPATTEIGWLAQQRPVPLGYLDDPDKSARTFPRHRRSSAFDTRRPGPLGRRREHRTARPRLGDHQLRRREDLRRGSRAAASAQHAAVYDVVVVGRPSFAGATKWWRWCNWPMARLPGIDVAGAILAQAARHIARYKLPKEVLFRDRVQRSPSGKADYRWAKAQVAR